MDTSKELSITDPKTKTRQGKYKNSVVSTANVITRIRAGLS